MIIPSVLEAKVWSRLGELQCSPLISFTNYGSMAGAIYSQHKEGDSVVRWIEAQPSALAGPKVVCAALLSMVGHPDFEIKLPIRKMVRVLASPIFSVHF